MTDTRRSAEACPVCGEHRLAVGLAHGHHVQEEEHRVGPRRQPRGELAGRVVQRGRRAFPTVEGAGKGIQLLIA